MKKPFVPFDKFEKSCAPLGKPLAETMQESCDDKFAPTPPVPCSAKPCPPYWQRTCEFRCHASGFVEYEETDGCGNTRWVRTSEDVVWVNDGENDCDDDNSTTERVTMVQLNQCGDERIVDAGRFCCTPEWVNVPGEGEGYYEPVYDCNTTMLRIEQEDGCGNERLLNTSTPVSWTDLGGSRRCNEGNYERQERNQCGDTRWAVISPFVWTDTGETRCDGSLIEKEQENQCGDLRWVVTDTSLAWTDTGVTDCTTTYKAQQENQCGALRMQDRGAVVWTNTGETRCGPVSENIENEQSNQCGDLRWTDTGVACDAPVPALPEFAGGGCFVDNPSSATSTYFLRYASNGTGTEKTVFGSGTSPFSWAPGVVDGAGYEIKVDYDFAGSSASYSGPTEGVWTSMAALTELVWTVTGPTPSGAYLTGFVHIRRVGETDPETTCEIVSTFISVGVECP